MDQLQLGLFAEGSTDDRFLPSIIYRTSQRILTEHNKNEVYDIKPIKLIKLIAEEKKDRALSILEAAVRACDYHMLIVHADADAPTFDDAYKHRIDPGLKLVKSAREHVCKELLPIIPIQAIESWMLADHQALLKELKIDKKAIEVELPKSRQIEAIAKPKMRLKQILEKVNATRSRRQRVEIDELYKPLGETIDLEKLKMLSSYQNFVADLRSAFTSLDVIS
jgi:hypothetical protein